MQFKKYDDRHTVDQVCMQVLKYNDRHTVDQGCMQVLKEQLETHSRPMMCASLKSKMTDTQ